MRRALARLAVSAARPRGWAAARGSAAAAEAPEADDPREAETKGTTLRGKPLYLDMQVRRSAWWHPSRAALAHPVQRLSPLPPCCIAPLLVQSSH